MFMCVCVCARVFGICSIANQAIISGRSYDIMDKLDSLAIMGQAGSNPNKVTHAHLHRHPHAA